MFKYEIGEKTYIQKKLVMGQVEYLIGQIEGITFPITNDPRSIKAALAEKIYIALAIVLVEEGRSPKREIEEVEKIAQEIRWTIDAETILKVIEDFFDCNPIASLLERLKGLTEKIKGMEDSRKGTGLVRQSLS